MKSLAENKRHRPFSNTSGTGLLITYSVTIQFIPQMETLLREKRDVLIIMPESQAQTRTFHQNKPGHMVHSSYMPH